MIIDCHTHLNNYHDEIPPRDRQMMLYENAAKLFRIPLPPTASGGGLFGMR